MKNKSLIIVAVLSVAFVAGAYFLYNKLAPQHEMNSLIVESTSQDNIKQEETSQPDGKAETQTETETEKTTESASQEEAQRPEAPDFTVYDAEGNAVNLSDFEGKPTVVNFWASWCGPCQAEMPDFQQKYEEYEDEIQFIMVNVTDGSRETVETAQKFIENNGYTFPVYFDTAKVAVYSFGAYSYPQTYFIDAEGKAAARASGMINAELLQTGIDMIYTP